MSHKTMLYLSLLAFALVVLALGGWLAKGVKSLGRTRRPSFRPRYA